MNEEVWVADREAPATDRTPPAPPGMVTTSSDDGINGVSSW